MITSLYRHLTHARFRFSVRLFAVLLPLMLMLSACDTHVDHPVLSQAQTPYTFVDLSGSGSCSVTSFHYTKDGALVCSESSPLTFWYDPSDTQNRLIVCSMDQDKNSYFSTYNGCEYHLPPKLLDQSARLVAVNVGASEMTQSVWSTPSGLMLCEHDAEWMDFVQVGYIACDPFKQPSSIPAKSSLLSLNSGLHIESTEVWQDPTEKLWKCDVNPFRRTGGTNGSIMPFKKNNKTRGPCTSFDLPDSSQLPDGAGKLTFIGLNSDLQLNWEFFYTTNFRGDHNTYVVRCIYDYHDPWDTSDPQWEEIYGNVAGCDWYFGLQPQHLADAA